MIELRAHIDDNIDQLGKPTLLVVVLEPGARYISVSFIRIRVGWI